MKTIIPLVLAIVVGVVTVMFGRQLIAGRGAVRTADAGPVAEVLVTAADLEVGQELTARDVKLVQAPVALVPTMAVRDVKAATGRIVAAPLTRGQMLTEAALAPLGTMGGLQAAVPAGKRAVTVEVNEVSGLSGMLRPGARVDIVATLTDEVTRETVTRAIVQNVPVSAVGTQMNKDGGGGEVKDAANGVQVKTVTLIVTPEQASALDLAYTRSRPRLVLRNAGEDDDSRFKPVTLQQLVRGTNPGASDEDRAHLKPATSGPGFTDLLAAMAAQRARQRAEPGATAAPPATQPVRRAVEVIRAGVPSLTYMENGKAATPETPAPKKAGMFESSNAH